MPKNGLTSGLDIALIVTGRRQESFDCQSVSFELPRNFNYASGHWMDICFPRDGLPDIKTFSFASSPTEPEIVIAFKNGVSKFKAALESVRPGDTMRITQYGGIFQFNPRVASVMIAGGIGIAPFRSMIKEALDTDSTADMVLVYINNSEDFPFKRELEVWEASLPGLTAHYINTKVVGRVTEKQLKMLVGDIAARETYVAGPPAMVTRTHEMLTILGAAEHNMHLDSFDGY